MAFAGAYTAVQSAPNSNQNVVFTDTSTGSDVNLIGRQIRPYDAAGNLVLPTGNTLGYIDWPLPLGTALTVDLLPKDYGLVITVNWLSSVPIGGSTYVATTLFDFTGYSDAFMYQMVENLSANPALRNTANWWYWFNRAQTDLDNTVRALNNLSILNIQENLDDVKYLIDNQAKLLG